MKIFVRGIIIKIFYFFEECQEINRAICVELYKTINKLNTNFMRDLFKLRFTDRTVREKHKVNMIIPEFNQVAYGKKCLRTFGAKLWNSLPYYIKSSENIESFKRTIKHWNGERYLLGF